MLILQASPRKNGNVWQMAEKIAEEYKSRNFQVETIDVTKMAFHDCIGCMKCRTIGKCIFNDDAETVGKKMEQADIICVASPVWWGNMPGHLKSLFDRNVFRMMGESPLGIPKPLMQGKNPILVSACTTPFPFNYLCGQTTGLKRAVKEIFKSSGIKLVKVISRGGTKK